MIAVKMKIIPHEQEKKTTKLEMFNQICEIKCM